MSKHGVLPLLALTVTLWAAIDGLRGIVVDVAGHGREIAPAGPGHPHFSADRFAEPGNEPPDWPRDHGAKPDRPVEYWLFAGSLADDAARAYGFQLAFFRAALAAGEPTRESAWAASDAYRAQMVVTAAGGSSEVGVRYSRAALGLAGAGRNPIRVWLENWQMHYDDEARTFHLDAADTDHGLSLRLSVPEYPPVVVEGAGYSGYWLPGLTARGTLTVAGRELPVGGQALMDRLWGRILPAGRGQLALSRLWLQLEDGSALRCRELRRRAGGGTPLGECLLRRQDGSSERFGRDRVGLEPETDGWRNLGGLRYPLYWRLELAGQGPPLRIRPLADERDGFGSPTWSGTVEVSGRAGGWGLLELGNHAAH